MSFSVSIIIPVYNEVKTVSLILEKVHSLKINKEIIVVDDGSTDGTRELLKTDLKDKIDNLILHPKNMGKGAAVRSGIEAATKDIVIVQDADLEYDPQDIVKILKTFEETNADVVFGSRYLLNIPRQVHRYWHSKLNGFLTSLSNMFSNLALTDMETCYKAFRREIIQNIILKENRFGIEPEITAKLAKIKKLRIYEVPISYNPRSKEEGKKIGFKDGLRALFVMIYYSIFVTKKKSFKTDINEIIEKLHSSN